MNGCTGDDKLNPAATAEATAGRARRRRKRRWRTVVAGLGLAYAAWLTVLYLMQDHLVFPAHITPRPSANLPADDVTVMRIPCDDGGHVEAWFIPAGSDPRGRRPVVLYFHGNAEIIDQQDPVVAGYQRLNCSVLLPEYRGYGRSAGKPSQRAILADNVRFFDEILKRPDVDPTRIVFHGRSLGGAVAVDLATQRKPDALILASTFTSVASMAHRYAAPEFLVTNPYRTERVLPSIGVPVLMFHGTRDTIVPVTHGRELARLAPGIVYREYNCGHNDFPGEANAAAYWGEIEKFLTEHGVIAKTTR